MSEIKSSEKRLERFELDEKKGIRDFLMKFGAFLGLIILCIVLTILSPAFLTVINIMNIASQVSVTCLLSFGMLLAILTSGIDLSVGSILGLAGCIMGITIVKMNMNPGIGVLMGLLVGSAFGFLNGVLLTKLKLPHPFISTMGTQNIARGLALVITAATPISGFPKFMQYAGGGFIGGVFPFSFIIVIVCGILMFIFLNRTPLGRHIYAVGGNKEAARLSGVNVDKVLIMVYTLSGLLCAIAAVVLTGRVNAAAPLAGLGAENDAIAACIIGGTSFFGGVGTVGGTLIGAFIMAVLRNGLNLLGASTDVQTIAIGAVIILAVYIDVVRTNLSGKAKRLPKAQKTGKSISA